MNSVSELKKIGEILEKIKWLTPREELQIKTIYELCRKIELEIKTKAEDKTKFRSQIGCVGYSFLECLLKENKLMDFIENIGNVQIENSDEKKIQETLKIAFSKLKEMMKFDAGKPNKTKFEVLREWMNNKIDGYLNIAIFSQFIQNLLDNFAKNDLKDILPNYQNCQEQIIKGYSLAYFFGTEFTIIHQSFGENNENSYIYEFVCSESISPNPLISKFNLKIQYSLAFIDNFWYILYEDNIEKPPLLTFPDLIQAPICLICNKQILNSKDNKIDDEKILFVSKNCECKHKFHTGCIRKQLYSKAKENPTNLLSGFNNLLEIQPSCVICESKLTLKELKELFPENFYNTYISLLSNSLETKFCEIFIKENGASANAYLSYKEIMQNSPFGMPSLRTASKFDLVVYKDGQKQEDLMINEDEFYKTFGEYKFISIFCAFCGKTLTAENNWKLSCRHLICEKCALDWIQFTNVTKDDFQNYIGVDKERVTWPICKCRHCGKNKDLVSVQLHNDHYISLKELIKQRLLNKYNLDYCIISGCSEKLKKMSNVLSITEPQVGIGKIYEFCDYAEQPIVDIKKMLDFYYGREDKINENKTKEDKIKFESFLKKMLSIYCATIDEKNRKLIVYMNLAAKLKAFFKEFEWQKFADDYYRKFCNFMNISNTICDEILQIPNIEIKKIQILSESAKENFLLASIYSKLYNYDFSNTRIVYFPLLNHLINENDFQNSIMKKEGPFGKGCYLFNGVFDAHQNNMKTNGIYKIIVCVIPYPIKKHIPTRNVCPNDTTRDTGNGIDADPDYNSEKNPSCMKGDFIGEFLIIRKENGMAKRTIVFEEKLIVPIAVISYEISFSH